jgi:osmotically-inducible protein OsmY
MKSTIKMRALAVLCGAALTITVAATSASAAASDPWITTKAKIALLTTKDVTASDVSVDTIDGKVTLHGTVPTAADKERAAAVVKNIDGVKSVSDLLQVVAARDAKVVEAKDDQIKQQVQTALASDHRLKGSDIEVSSVNKGVVLLSGKADSMTDHLEALNVAGKVAGVRRVESEVKADNRLTDASTTSDVPASKRTHDAVADAGSTASDMWITSAAKMRLLADGSTPALDINVDTRDGVVTLFGIVPTAAAKTAAEANARKVDGVKSIHNELQVVAAAKRQAVDAKDDDIERGVEKTLQQSTELEHQKIDVDVKDGVVRLTGSVTSEDDRLVAGFAARSTPGVRAVLVDDLQVKG